MTPHVARFGSSASMRPCPRPRPARSWPRCVHMILNHWRRWLPRGALSSASRRCRSGALALQKECPQATRSRHDRISAGARRLWQSDDVSLTPARAIATPSLHRAARAEDAVRGVIERRMRRRGWLATVLPYTGYGAPGWVRVMGRVLLDRSARGAEGESGKVRKPRKIRGWRGFAAVAVK